jgi:sec-independent protein translocase protein TatA
MYAEIFSPEIMGVLIVVILLVFGSSKIPQMARSLGSAKKEFEKGRREADSESDKSETA